MTYKCCHLGVPIRLYHNLIMGENKGLNLGGGGGDKFPQDYPLNKCQVAYRHLGSPSSNPLFTDVLCCLKMHFKLCVCMCVCVWFVVSVCFEADALKFIILLPQCTEC